MDKFPAYKNIKNEDADPDFLEKFRKARDNTVFKPPYSGKRWAVLSRRCRCHGRKILYRGKYEWQAKLFILWLRIRKKDMGCEVTK
jgi:hypothetical protein